MKPSLVTACRGMGTRESIRDLQKLIKAKGHFETFTWNWGTPNLANTKNLSQWSFWSIYSRISFLFLKLQWRAIFFWFLTSWYRAPPQKTMCYPKDHWTLQWKGLNLYSRGRVLKIAQFWGVRILRDSSFLPTRPFQFASMPWSTKIISFVP